MIKKLFSSLLIFSAFIVVALPFFSTPEKALAGECSCNTSLTETYSDCVSNGTCDLSSQSECTSVANNACAWTDACTKNINCADNCGVHSTDASYKCCIAGGEANCNAYCKNTPQNCIQTPVGLPSCSDLCDEPGTPASSPCDYDGTQSTCGDFDASFETNTAAATCFCTNNSNGAVMAVPNVSQKDCDNCAACANINNSIEWTCSLSQNNTAAQSGSNAQESQSGPNNSAASQPTSLNNPLGTGGKDVPTLINTIIKGALGVVGSLALLMFIYGGFTWMLAAGNESAVEKGKNILTWATIGLVIIFASYSLVGFVINAITGTK